MGSFENVYIVIIFITLEIVKYFVCVRRCRVQTFISIFKDFGNKISILLCAFFTLYLFTVLLGAPALSNFQETTMFVIYLVVFSTVPLCLYFNAEGALNILVSIVVYTGDSFDHIFKLKMRIILFGAWMGAVAIPLDWNRPWQQWPISCCVGGFVGFAVSNCISTFLYL